MIPEQRKHAGDAIRRRMREIDLSAPKLAVRMGVSESTIRRTIKGNSWPSSVTHGLLEEALDWPRGEVARRAVLDDRLPMLTTLTTDELLDHLCQVTGELRRRRRDATARYTSAEPASIGGFITDSRGVTR